MARDEGDWLRVLQEVGVAASTARKWAPVFARQIDENTFSAGESETPVFLAHTLVETGMLECLEENLNYSAGRISEIGMKSGLGTRWRAAVPKAMDLARNPRAFAEFMYGGRYGNTAPGDGWKYRGRGIPQVTFEANYALLAKETGLDLVNNPDQLLDPDTALRCGILFWEDKVKDATLGNNAAVTVEINGGHMAEKQRADMTDLCEKVMQA